MPTHDQICEWVRQEAEELDLLDALVAHARRSWTSFSLGQAIPYRLYVHHDNRGFYQRRHFHIQMNIDPDLVAEVASLPGVAEVVHAGLVGLGKAPPYRFAVRFADGVAESAARRVVRAALTNAFY